MVMHEPNDALLDWGSGSSMVIVPQTPNLQQDLRWEALGQDSWTSSLWTGLMLLKVLLCIHHALAATPSSTLSSVEPIIVMCGRPPQ